MTTETTTKARVQVDLSRIPNIAEREEVARLAHASVAAYEALEEAKENGQDSESVEALRAASAKADKEWEQHPLLLCDAGATRCALSGVPVLEDDEVLVDPETSEMVLRCLLLPPREA